MRILGILAATLALGAGIWFGQLRETSETTLRADWSLPDQNGTLRRAAEFDGRWQLVNFWASWCPPCLQEIPLLLATARENPQLQILGPAMDHIESAQAAAERLGISYPVLLGDRAVSQWMTDLGDTQGALPFSVLIGPEGHIRERHWGELNPEILAQWLKPLHTSAESEKGS